MNIISSCRDCLSGYKEAEGQVSAPSFQSQVLAFAVSVVPEAHRWVAAPAIEGGSQHLTKFKPRSRLLQL